MGFLNRRACGHMRGQFRERVRPGLHPRQPAAPHRNGRGQPHPVGGGGGGAAVDPQGTFRCSPRRGRLPGRDAPRLGEHGPGHLVGLLRGGSIHLPRQGLECGLFPGWLLPGRRGGQGGEAVGHRRGVLLPLHVEAHRLRVVGGILSKRPAPCLRLPGPHRAALGSRGG